MCGIVGMVALDGKPVPTEHLRWMSAAASHRGPDDSGFYVEAGAALGMTRLSIIDRDGGHQPIRNEDGSVWVVLNGEIYNYKKLTQHLRGLGHTFTSESDTEVIVHLYEELGADCVKELNGMFAFALWDRRRKVLLLARDRLGIKPLYYTLNDGCLLFGSELKSILQVPTVDRRIDWSAFAHLLAFLHTPATQSIIEGVHKLEPGHVMLAVPGAEPATRRYWDLQYRPDERRTERDWVAELRERLRASVRSQLVSDVPVGAFLSGGIDSSAVAAFMTTLMDQPVKTFSIGFSESAYNELDGARAVARHLGTEHREQVIGPAVAPALEEISWYLDEPFGDSSAIPTYFVSRLAADHVTVVLSGDGGDEVFAGYDKYVVEQRERRLERLAGPARLLLKAVSLMLPDGVRGHNLASHYALSGARRYLDSVTLFRRPQIASLLRPAVLAQIGETDPLSQEEKSLTRWGGDWLFALQEYDIRSYLPLDILTKVDRMSMANSIETRVPLLDHELVEFAATIPSSLKLHNGETKYIFKRAMEGILPAAVLRKRKQGFAVPLDDWFRGPLREMLRDHLLSGSCARRGIFDQHQIERLVRRHDEGRDLGMHLWTLLSFELWCRRYLDLAPALPASQMSLPAAAGGFRVAAGGRR